MFERADARLYTNAAPTLGIEPTQSVRRVLIPVTDQQVPDSQIGDRRLYDLAIRQTAAPQCCRNPTVPAVRNTPSASAQQQRLKRHDFRHPNPDSSMQSPLTVSIKPNGSCLS